MLAKRPDATKASPTGSRRILHVVGGLDHGGIEVWLLNMLKRVDRSRYQMDFFIVGERPGTLAQEFARLGARITLCAKPRWPWRLASDFRAALRHGEPYDVIHAHIHHFDGVILRLAARHRVPIRIAHSHNDTSPAEAGAAAWRRLYLAGMKRWIRRYATHHLAVSRKAGDDLFGPDWATAIATWGLDFKPWALHHERNGLRNRLGLPADALVLGHVGWFQWRKNHDFLIEVAAAVWRREARVHLLLIGEGERRPAIEARIATLGMADRVVFAGVRNDVPALMHAMDAFVFPSHHEGAPLALVEAQAAGLPCVISDGIAEEIDVVPGLVHRLSLEESPDVWADRILAAVRGARPSQAEALETVNASGFEIGKSLENLQQVYERAP